MLDRCSCLVLYWQRTWKAGRKQGSLSAVDVCVDISIHPPIYLVPSIWMHYETQQKGEKIQIFLSSGNSHFGGGRWACLQAVVTSKVLWSFSIRQNPKSEGGKGIIMEGTQRVWCFPGVDNSWMLGGDQIMKGLVWGGLELCSESNRNPGRILIKRT